MSAIKRMLEDIIEETLDLIDIHGMEPASALLEVANKRNIPDDQKPSWINDMIQFIPK